MEIEGEQEAASAMLKLHTSPPMSPFLIPTHEMFSTVPKLNLDNYGTSAWDRKVLANQMTENLDSLINALERSIPVRRSRKQRSSSMTQKPRSMKKKVDAPVEFLPRLRSQRRRRNSISLTFSSKKRSSSVDSDAAVSEPGIQSYYGQGSSFGVDKVGGYSMEERKELIRNYLMKRKTRVWKKKIKYRVRKTFADSRLRVKGRFISKQDESYLREALLCAI